MPRPPDLPQPIRHHLPHESTADAGRRRQPVPGPGAYGTLPIPKSHVGGVFMHGSRFSKGQLDPSDLRTPSFRENALDVPGPKYDPILELHTKQDIQFSKAPRNMHEPPDDLPGPGQYSVESVNKELWGRGVSFTRSQRQRQKIAASHLPAPGAYSPTPIVRHKPAAGFGSAPRFRSSTLPLMASPSPASRASPSVTSAAGRSASSTQRSAFAYADDETTPGPKYDPDYTFTRPKIAPDISFSKAPRTFARPTSATAAITAYNLSYSVIDKRPRSAILYLGA